MYTTSNDCAVSEDVSARDWSVGPVSGQAAEADKCENHDNGDDDDDELLSRVPGEPNGINERDNISPVAAVRVPLEHVYYHTRVALAL